MTPTSETFMDLPTPISRPAMTEEETADMLEAAICPEHGQRLIVNSINTETGELQVYCPHSTECEHYDQRVGMESIMYHALLDRMHTVEDDTVIGFNSVDA